MMITRFFVSRLLLLYSIGACLLFNAYPAVADNAATDADKSRSSVISGRVIESPPVIAVAVQDQTEDQSDDRGLVLTAEQWDMARSGETVIQLNAIRTVVNEWLKDRGNQIEIRYPGGEEGEFWVHELTDWLISLGIPSDKLIKSPGSGAADVIRLQLSRDY